MPPDPIPEILEKIHHDLEDLTRVVLSMTEARTPQCAEVLRMIAIRLGLPDPHDHD